MSCAANFLKRHGKDEERLGKPEGDEGNR
jgi:hypothetical protein